MPNKIKTISLVLGIFGGVLALEGYMRSSNTITNLGISGIFLAMVILSLVPSECIRKEFIEDLLREHRVVTNSIMSALELEGNAVFIPPFKNLSQGGIFIPLYRDFELDLPRIYENAFFIIGVSDEKSMGLFLGSYGNTLLEKYEAYLGAKLDDVDIASLELAVNSVLKTLTFLKNVHIISEKDNKYKLIIKGKCRCFSEYCSRLPCPICSSILLALAMVERQILFLESLTQNGDTIQIIVKSLGGIEKWL